MQNLSIDNPNIGIMSLLRERGRIVGGDVGGGALFGAPVVGGEDVVFAAFAGAGARSGGADYRARGGEEGGEVRGEGEGGGC